MRRRARPAEPIMRLNGRMEFANVVRKRRMVRAYDPSRPVPRAEVEDLLALAVHAPSAGFSQGWQFLVLDAPATRDAFWSATTSPDAAPDSWLTGLRTAPVIVVAFSDKDAYLDRYAEPDKGWTDRDEARWPVPYWHIDTGMAALLVLLGAVDSGLAACFFGVPTEHWDALRAAFQVPSRLTPIGAISLGHGAPDRRSPSLRRGRRPMSDVVAYGSFARPE
jgi:nitroreductase